MSGHQDIWTGLNGAAESVVQGMSNSLYGFFYHGFCILGVVWILCELAKMRGIVKPALNWSFLVLSLVLTPKIPILIPDSTTMKLLLLLACVAGMIIAPSRLALFLSSNGTQRRYVQVALIALLLLLFVAGLITGRGP